MLEYLAPPACVSCYVFSGHRSNPRSSFLTTLTVAWRRMKENYTHLQGFLFSGSQFRLLYLCSWLLLSILWISLAAGDTSNKLAERREEKGETHSFQGSEKSFRRKITFFITHRIKAHVWSVSENSAVRETFTRDVPCTFTSLTSCKLHPVHMAQRSNKSKSSECFWHITVKWVSCKMVLQSCALLSF